LGAKDEITDLSDCASSSSPLCTIVDVLSDKIMAIGDGSGEAAGAQYGKIDHIVPHIAQLLTAKPKRVAISERATEAPRCDAPIRIESASSMATQDSAARVFWATTASTMALPTQAKAKGSTAFAAKKKIHSPAVRGELCQAMRSA
jgi:hypothetical protein